MAALEGDDLAKVFHRFDSNGDGRISAAELHGIVVALGMTVGSPEEEVGRMMAEMDIDGDGFVDLKEFEAFFAQHGSDQDEDAQLMDAFRTYDLDGNGKISAKELHRVMRMIGEKCSLGDCARMIKSVDADGDGCVNFGEFKKMMAGAGAGAGGRSSAPSEDRKKR